MKLKLLILSFSLLLISCIEVRDPEKNKKTEEAPAVVQQPVAEVKPLSKPQAYAVKIKGVEAMSQIMRRPMDILAQMQTAQIPVLNVEAEDIVDQPGLYEYVVQQNGQTYQLQVRIPQDYIIEGDMKVEQLTANVRKNEEDFRTVETEGRLFFKAGSTLTTDGENLLFKAASIESEGAMIQTFPMKSTAAPGQPGRHGGDIKLEAQRLRGTIQFFMRGENGGDGESSTLGVKKTMEQLNNNGQKGGNSGLLEVSIADKSRGGVTLNLEPGHGGKGVEIHRFNFCISEHCPKENTLYKPRGLDGFDGVTQQPVGIRN